MIDQQNYSKSLNSWYELANRTIISLQHHVSGLIPAQPGSDTWVRDCTYAIHSIWALTLAYEKLLGTGESTSLYHELRGRTIKGMRGLLYCMMQQCKKVYKFIATQSHLECLHAKYDTRTGRTTVGDNDWGHLQMDATSLFLLTLAQITSSGIVIIQSLSEVDFVQKLVQYIMFAYRTPDFGVFERGDKNNRGIRELSCCSVGLAKAALVAMRNLNLFGANGGLRSVIKVPLELSRQCSRVLQSILPRGSASKEFDSSVLSILSYPAFAVENDEVVRQCKDLIDTHLKGKYGYKRFLMDGYKTALEDKNRLHYDTGELKNFEGIECEWPLYLIYSWIDALFNDDDEEARKIRKIIDDDLVVNDKDGFSNVPEFYYVPEDVVQKEKSNNGSQKRLCGGKIPFVWAQSLYILAGLLHDGYITISDIDPLNRRQAALKKPSPIVQILLVAQDTEAMEFAKLHKLQCTQLKSCAPLTIITPGVVTRIWEGLGFTLPSHSYSYAHNKVSSLRTSIVYQHQNNSYISVPEYAYRRVFYDNIDTDMFINKTIARITYLSTQWYSSGRPTLLIMLDKNKIAQESFVGFLQTLKSGSYLGVQVKIVSTEVALTTSAKEQVPTFPQLVCTPVGLHTTIDGDNQYWGCISTQLFSADVLDNALLDVLRNSHNLSQKWVAISDALERNNKVLPLSVKSKVEDMYIKACEVKNWYVIRHCAAILQKTHHSLCDDVTHLLVNQMQISFGFDSEEETITQPPSASAMFNFCLRHSKECYVYFSLYQEVLMCLTQVAQKSIAIFNGILRIRLNLLINLIAREVGSNDIDSVCKVSPITIYNSIYNMLSGATETETDNDIWGQRRYIDGCLNRLPKQFHLHLYTLLSISRGINIEGNVFYSYPIVNEMTSGEPQFAILVENWLDKVIHPELRQLYVEVIIILAHFYPNLELSFTDQIIELEGILRDAHNCFVEESDCDTNLSLHGICHGFYSLAPSGRFGTLSYITRIIAAMGT